MANVRTYSQHVRVGNWSEDIVLDEEMLKDFLGKKERGELTVQKVGRLKQNLLKKVDLSVSRDGWLRFGDVIMLENHGRMQAEGLLDLQEPVRNSAAIAMNADISTIGAYSVVAPCEVSASTALEPCARTAFVITSVDGTPVGEPLRYHHSFALQTTRGFSGGLYLTSDHKTFQKCAKRSRLQEVSLTEQALFPTWWQVEHLDPQERMENEGLPVPVNTKVLVVHCKTNQCLAILGNYHMWTPFGKEYEVTAQTFLDSHKAEQEMNHWLFVTSDPGAEGQAITCRPEPMASMQAPQEAGSDTNDC